MSNYVKLSKTPFNLLLLPLNRYALLNVENIKDKKIDHQIAKLEYPPEERKIIFKVPCHIISDYLQRDGLNQHKRIDDWQQTGEDHHLIKEILCPSGDYSYIGYHAKLRQKRVRNVIQYRRRRMRKYKRRKWLKKYKFVIQKKQFIKKKEEDTLDNMEKSIILKRAEVFDPEKWVERELEKAKFVGYKMKSFDTYENIRARLKNLKMDD
ncbi:hypothetical protein GJ496_006706 [Pomphorhynchus laevis]|nr:hypothetical protein GJ496_006706 [Pomphorhynchus laevis]